MSELDRELRALAAAVDYPPTPDLASRVAARIAAERRPQSRLPLRSALLVAGLWLAVTATTVVAAARPVADALLDASGLVGVKLERTAEPAPVPAPRALDLGTRFDSVDAVPGLSFAPLVPRVAGGPDGVYGRPATPGGEISLVYPPGPELPRTTSTDAGLLVTEFRGDLAPEYLTKIAPVATTVERVVIDGDRGIWIGGAPHFFAYREPDGDLIERDLEVAENVLLLERGPVLIRMEGAFDRATAVRLAASLQAEGTSGDGGLY
jgi:hypothetical protein